PVSTRLRVIEGGAVLEIERRSSPSVIGPSPSIDIFSPLCLGQRLGILAGSGVGKSTLLSMLARADDFDKVVIALVGERGR
ncbi:flagellum-specific ATP synthase FliI, partial [Rhizobium leguminosarum]